MRRTILGISDYKYENTLKDKFLVKILKLSQEDLDKANQKAVKVSRYLSIRKDKKYLWNYLSTMIKYVKSLDQEQFEKLIVFINNRLKGLSKDNNSPAEFIVSIFLEIRCDNSGFIGKYLSAFKKQLGDINKLCILSDIFIHYWNVIYFSDNNIKFDNENQTYKNKQLYLSFKGVNIRIDNDYSKTLGTCPAPIFHICGMVIDKINKLEYNKLELYLSFIISTYNIKDITLVVEEQEDRIMIVGKTCLRN